MNGDLKRHLEANKQYLRGYWIEKNASYENDICGLLGMTSKKSRYWDAEWNGILLEFKDQLQKSWWADKEQTLQLFWI